MKVNVNLTVFQFNRYINGQNTAKTDVLFSGNVQFQPAYCLFLREQKQRLKAELCKALIRHFSVSIRKKRRKTAFPAFRHASCSIYIN